MWTVATNSDDFFFVPEGFNGGCQGIAAQSDMSLTQFMTWNLGVGGRACD
jgi:hypothetical protein